MSEGLLLLRVVLGLVVAAHGAQKLFGWFGGPGLAGTSGWLESMGFRPGKLHAGVTGLAEFGGGLLLALGFLTPLGAAAVIGVMTVAIVTVHSQNGFFNTSGGFEFNLVLLVAAATLAFTGPGEYSVDLALDWDLYGTRWGMSALALAVVTAGLTLAARRDIPSRDAQTA
jgi:putative oxidoreductase